jgi:hypothetical protein
VRFTCCFLATTLLFLLAGGTQAADASKKKESASFGVLRTPNGDEVRNQAEAWLKGAGKTDAATMKKFDELWKSDRLLLDKVAETFSLGDATVAKLLAAARDINTPAPIEVPAILKDTKNSAFFRTNLALAYAKALSNRKVYEEGLEALRLVKPEQAVDPAGFLFHKAVAEHALMLKKDADDTIIRLLDDVADAPDRYKLVAALMHFDMAAWKDKDLGWIARKMDNIQRRLDLTRGGEKTQKMQKEVVMRLDELIKQLENQNKSDCDCNGGGCPSSGQSKPGNNPNNNTQASSPQNDSNGGNGSGPGQVDPKKVKELAEVWGKLPERERAKAMLDLTRDMPPRYRAVIEDYFRKLSQLEASK